jgi:hypothetical protein
MLMPAMIVFFIQGSRTTNQTVAANGKYNISPTGLKFVIKLSKQSLFGATTAVGFAPGPVSLALQHPRFLGTRSLAVAAPSELPFILSSRLCCTPSALDPLGQLRPRNKAVADTRALPLDAHINPAGPVPEVDGR